MAKAKTVFFCTNCGNESPKWQGRCPACGAWNTFEEHIEKPIAAGKAKPNPVGQSRKPQRISEVNTEEEIRFHTGMGELDRVLGGGAVAGSLVLVSGAPGIGKSTLLLQICNSLCTGRSVLYVSGEESERQLKLRAQRLGVAPESLFILSETRLSDILEAVEELKPDILMIDSIQTLYREENESSPGSVSQVKDCTMAMMQLSKSQGITVFVVGHINKDGNIAGPKVLEHMVDCVLYFEGDPNSSQMLLEGRPEGASGTCVACVMEGTRPVLAEVQALVAKTMANVPRRASDGFDFNRMMLLLAVAEKRAGLKMGAFDAYLNVIGGLRLDEPGADLPVALAVASSYRDQPIADDLVAIGEVGLTGEIRSVSHLNQRLGEVARLGFKKCVVPRGGSEKLEIPRELTVYRVRNLREAIEMAF